MRRQQDEDFRIYGVLWQAKLELRARMFNITTLEER
jgi:hypothetical protein